jgi:drug/metabolite transporter (DMT)-like permease
MLLGVAGIIHFVAGRLLAYNSYRLIGVNKATVLVRTSPLYTVILGFLFLSETLTIFLIFGVLCIFAGVVLVGTERKGVSQEEQRGDSGTEVKGIITALGGALCWGITPVLIKPAVEEIGSASVAAFVSYIAASIVMALFLFRRQHREQLVQPRFLTALIPIIIGGIFVSLAQLLNYAALIYSPASMVAPLISTNVLFILLLSFLFNRNIEVFTLKVILGMVAVALGAFLICY